MGRRYRCPCCNWRVRGFVAGGGSLRRRDIGYCPRCNSKARHRRLWLELDHNWTSGPGARRVLVISPHESTLRALTDRGLRHISIDLTRRPGIHLVGNTEHLPFADAVFDLVISVHVLEHVGDDRRAMRETARVLSADGLAVVNVPCDLSRSTLEDPSVTSGNDRRKLFGEPDHVRWYGADIVDRLVGEGLEVEVLRAGDLDRATIERFGLKLDEHLFVCRRTPA